MGCAFNSTECEKFLISSEIKVCTCSFGKKHKTFVQSPPALHAQSQQWKY